MAAGVFISFYGAVLLSLAVLFLAIYLRVRPTRVRHAPFGRTRRVRYGGLRLTAVNQELSVDEMKRLALARGSAIRTDQFRTRIETEETRIDPGAGKQTEPTQLARDTYDELAGFRDAQLLRMIDEIKFAIEIVRERLAPFSPGSEPFNFASEAAQLKRKLAAYEEELRHRRGAIAETSRTSDPVASRSLPAERPAASASDSPAFPIEQLVECSVFGPPAAPPGETVLIQVFLHLANQAERATFLASAMDASAKLKATKSLDLPIKRGARVEIAFSANGLEVDEPVQSVVWRGEPTFCQFLAKVPAGTGGQSFFPALRVSVNGKLLGAIKFHLSSDAAASQPTSEPLGDHARRYKYVFISYASTDRKEVLKRVQMLEIMKTKYFQDILSLDPGDRWEKKLYQNIDRCDLFLLFWSQAAKDSQWVLKEAEYALAHQQKNRDREPDLVPVILEQNVLPPPSLSTFHFNDRISYLVSLMS